MDFKLYNLLSIFAITNYAFMMFNYSKQIIDLKVKKMTIYLFTIIFATIVILLSLSSFPYFYSYIIIYFCIIIIYRICYKSSLLAILFAAGNFVFHLLSLKGIIVSLMALLYGTRMYTIIGNGVLRSYSVIILFISGAIFLIIFKKLISYKSIRLLVDSRKNLEILTYIQIILNLSIGFFTYVYYLHTNDIWIIIFQLVVSILMMIGFYIVFKYIIALCLHEESKNNENVLNQQVKAQLEQYNNLAKYLKELRRLKHDYGNQIKGLKYLIDNNDFEQVKIYIDDLNKNISQLKSFYNKFSDNILVDAILQEANSKAISANVEFSAQVILNGLSLSGLELCTLFSNILNNAIEATQIVNDGKGFIKVSSYKKGNLLIINQSNSFVGKLKKKGDVYLTTKEDTIQHGIGIETMRQIVSDHDGIFEINVDETNMVFQLTIILNLS
ncbi:MAG: GHKL domain-containing protein [Erysipelotrichaceae bacterium]